MSPVRFERLPGAGVSLNVARAGEGAPVILLHGFPEGWRSWSGQIEPLANAGFSVLAPDLRGYGGSDRPGDTGAYRLRLLLDDVEALIQAAGARRAHVVGHDWGGVIAWSLAIRRPELVDRLVILNAPHPRIYRLRLAGPQLLRSAYILFFLVPRLPERVLAAFDFRLLRTIFRSSEARRGSVPDELIDHYVEQFGTAAGLTGPLAYYRANARRGSRGGGSSTGRVESPTLVVWGERDPALGTQLLDGLERYVPDLRVLRLPEVGHWVQHEATEQVNGALVEFLRR
jgi:epoxide hydrolase 4